MRHFAKICNSFKPEGDTCRAQVVVANFRWAKEGRVKASIFSKEFAHFIGLDSAVMLLYVGYPRPRLIALIHGGMDLHVDEFMRMKAAEIDERELLAATSKTSEKWGMRL